jgi:SWI/SNF-related matrix-associated actin-dependent regulator 1 of chromatin subfamily A
MFGNNSWKQLPKWSYLLAYKDDQRFIVLTNRAKLPDGVQRYNSWEKYNSVVQTLRERKLPIEEVPAYVFLAKKYERKAANLKPNILSKITYWNDLYIHQKKAVAYGVAFKGRTYFADEMGCGKTLSAITLLNYLLLERGGYHHILILCPASVKKNWKDVVDTKLLCEGRVDILSYDKAKNSSKDLKKQKYSIYIADEAHCLKSPKTQRYKKLAPVLKRIEYRILLSGTPTVNRSDELYSPLSLLYPKLFKKFRAYNDRYFNMIARKCRLPEELSLILPMFGFVRRLKSQVLKLPEKIVTYHSVDVIPAKEALKKMMKKMLKPENMANTNFQKYLIGEAFHALGTIKSNSEVIQHLLMNLLVPDETKGKQKVVFCFHKSMIQCVQTLAERLHYTFDTINGETPSKKRGEIVDSFQAGKTQILICSINAAGVGITLTKSNHIILAESSWVPGLNQQAIDRVHRIGQTKAVYVDRIHCKHSIDDFIQKCEDGKSKMHKVLLKKAKDFGKIPTHFKNF